MEISIDDNDLKHLISGKTIFINTPTSIGWITVAVLMESQVRKTDRDITYDKKKEQ